MLQAQQCFLSSLNGQPILNTNVSIPETGIRRPVLADSLVNTFGINNTGVYNQALGNLISNLADEGDRIADMNSTDALITEFGNPFVRSVLGWASNNRFRKFGPDQSIPPILPVDPPDAGDVLHGPD